MVSCQSTLLCIVGILISLFLFHATRCFMPEKREVAKYLTERWGPGAWLQAINSGAHSRWGQISMRAPWKRRIPSRYNELHRQYAASCIHFYIYLYLYNTHALLDTFVNSTFHILQLATTRFRIVHLSFTLQPTWCSCMIIIHDQHLTIGFKIKCQTRIVRTSSSSF